MKELIRLKCTSFVNRYSKKINRDGFITGLQAIAVISFCIYFTYTGSFDTPGETVITGQEPAPEIIATGYSVFTLPGSIKPAFIRDPVRMPDANFSLSPNYCCLSNQPGLTALGCCVHRTIVEDNDWYLQKFVYKGLQMRSLFSKSRFIHTSYQLFPVYKTPVVPDLIYAAKQTHVRYP